MDQLIRIGLLFAWVAFGIAALLWWWRHLYGARRYSYSERATAIQEALRQSADLGVIYWSKTEKRFLRRALTPLELDGYSLKAFDHTDNDIRVFKVTRLKTVEVVPRGSNKVPPLASATGLLWVLTGLGGTAIALLAVALYRGRGASEEFPPLPPPPLHVMPSSVSTDALATTDTSATVVATAPMDTSTVTKVADAVSPAATAATPTTSVAVITGSLVRWQVVVFDHPMYDTNLVATALKKLLNCSRSEAMEYSRQMRLVGQVRVWEGKWTKAEVLRQTLEAQDIDSKVQRVEPEKSAADAPRQ